MGPQSPASQGLNGAAVDGRWFTDLMGFVRETPWLHAPVLAYADYGIALFAVFALLVWWRARHGDPTAMAAALWVPVATVVGFLANDIVKSVFDEPRPCRSIPGVSILVPCDAPTDWAFPSNHSAIAAAAAVALLLAHRRIGAIAVLAALLMAFSRVYVGAHYPHDVIAGLALGGLLGLTGLPGRAWLTPVVVRLRATRIAPLVGTTAAPADPERAPIT